MIEIPPKYFSVLLTSLSLSIFLSGCISSPQSVVVERSKEQRPAWVDLEPDKSHSGEAQIQFHGLGEREPDLPLGIKRTQIKALDGSEAGLGVLIRERMDAVASGRKISPSVVNSPEVAAVVIDSTKRSHGTYAKVVDIYFERHQVVSKAPVAPEVDLKPDYYLVHILVQYPRDQVAPVLLDIGRVLQKSRNTDVKRFGQALMTPEGPVSH